MYGKPHLSGFRIVLHSDRVCRADFGLSTGLLARCGAGDGNHVFADWQGSTQVSRSGADWPGGGSAPKSFLESDAVHQGDIHWSTSFWPNSSLGGARPKASVRDRDGALVIAKFPHKDDEFNTVAWEAVALSLAAKARIATAPSQFEQIAEKPVLLLRRFDRDGATRIPFLSAMSMLGAKDNETHSYLEIVDALRQSGARPKEDMHELWRRIVFTIMISNSDDHMRNHGFLYVGADGWVLSPAYDLNPVPVDIKPRVLSTAIDLDDQTASLDVALSVADYFELKPAQARRIAEEVAVSVSGWREEAGRVGLTARECDRMASAFEHRDLRAALKK
jgi:serine/threonine-protein kinase HipA